MSDEKIPITEEGLERLKAELEHLTTIRRPAIIKAIAAAREEGDLRENAGYDAARHDQAMNERRIMEIEDRIRRAVVIDQSGATSVQVGTMVTIDIDGEEETYTIVGAVEARPAEGRISNESPIGKALLGRKVGDVVDIRTPTTVLKAKVVSINGAS
ncbi:MAG TPA: transcription elongation factor GreA [Thermomicrobiales bacterium]|nr:transcription elongation factor GreA [Thermomicrobiales bacterium]